jgi:hypothetical protein
MTAILRSMLLSLITLTVMPAWQTCCGQDSPATTTVSEENQQPQQPPATPGPQQTTTPSPGAASPSSTLDDTVDAGEMDDGMEQPRRGMAK